MEIRCANADLRLHRRARAADPDRRRGDLSPPAGVRDRDRRQVRRPALGGGGRRLLRPCRPFEDEWGFYGAAEPRRRAAAVRRRLVARSARPHHPGRTASHLRAARHRRRPLRDGARPAGVASPSSGRRIRPKIVASHRDGAAGGGADRGAVRPQTDRGLPAARARSARQLLRARPSRRSTKPARLYVGLAAPGTGPKLVFLRALTRRCCAGGARSEARRPSGRIRRPLSDGALLLQRAARTRRRAPHRRGRGARRARDATATQRRRVDPPDQPFADRTTARSPWS